MGCELLETEPLFLETVKQINSLLNQYEEISLIDEFKALEDDSRLEETKIAQPLLFALQVGMLHVLVSKGLQVDAVIGHSVGEVAAAYASGILSLENAVRVIYQRSHAQSKTRGAGRMAAVAVGVEEILTTIKKLGLNDEVTEVTIAGINSPKAVTLSGSLSALQSLSMYFKERGVFYKLLDLDYAFHSDAMDPVEAEIINSLGDLPLKQEARSFYSTVTGGKLSGDKLGANYWWDNIRKPVLFLSSMNQMLDDGYQVFLEIGPHPVLRSYINDCGRDKEQSVVALSTSKRQGESKTALLNSLHSCYLAGCTIDETKVFSTKHCSTDLPSYPWQREKHWYTLTAEGSNLVNRHRDHPLLGYRLKDQDACWENQIDTQLLSYLNDHVVDGGAVMPAAAYIETALAATVEYFGSDEDSENLWEVENLEIRAPIVLDVSKTIRFKLLIKDGSFIISSRDRLTDNPFTENVVGRLLGKTSRQVPQKLSISSIINNAQQIITAKGHYNLTESVGLTYGTTFQGIDEVWVSGLESNEKNALARIKVPTELVSTLDNYLLHPALLDAGFQVLVDIFSEKIEQGTQAALIPVQVGKLYYYSSMKDLAYIYVDINKQSPQSVLADYLLLNADGEVLAELKACRFRAVQLTRSRAVLPASYEFKPLLMPYQISGQHSSVPEPAALVTHAVEFLGRNEKELHRSRHYQEVLPLFDLMVSMFAWQAIRALNPKGDEFTLASLAEQAHIESVKLPLLSRLLSILVEDDLATYENEQWLLATESDLPAAEDIWLSVLGDSPSYLPELILLGRCGKHLSDVLQHKVEPEKILFANKSSIQEHWSGASPSNLSMNLALKDTLLDIVKDWPANRRLRILEVGGMNTEISQLLLPILPIDQCDYSYIHHNDEMLTKASFDLEPWDFVTTEILDLSQDFDLTDSSVLAASYDIIIAANTLYHSDDCSKSQKNIRKLLAPKGALLLLERQSDRFMDMTFGLQTEWWTHTSEESAPIPLLMTAQEWRIELKENGFDQVELLVEPEATGDTGAFMVVASYSDEAARALDTSSFLSDSSSIQTQTWMLLKDSSELSGT